MNDNLVRQIEKAGISQYKLSRETGITYTTLSRLKRGTLDINNCTSEVVYRLSLYLGCGMEEILNPVRFLSGIKGTYKGYSYHWEVEGKQRCSRYRQRRQRTIVCLMRKKLCVSQKSKTVG